MRTLPDRPVMSQNTLEKGWRENPMPLDVQDPRIEKAFLEKVQAFVNSQPRIGRAKLLGFFHLANLETAAEITFHVDASGLMALNIVARATAD